MATTKKHTGIASGFTKIPNELLEASGRKALGISREEADFLMFLIRRAWQNGNVAKISNESIEKDHGVSEHTHPRHRKSLIKKKLLGFSGGIANHDNEYNVTPLYARIAELRAGQPEEVEPEDEFPVHPEIPQKPAPAPQVTVAPPKPDLLAGLPEMFRDNRVYEATCTPSDLYTFCKLTPRTYQEIVGKFGSEFWDVTPTVQKAVAEGAISRTTVGALAYYHTDTIPEHMHAYLIHQQTAASTLN